MFHSSLHPVSHLSYRDGRDEYADVKHVKLLRRGRRLQQVEQVYGKSPTSETALSPARSPSLDIQPRQSIIPQLKAEFFASAFFSRFNMQRKFSFARVLFLFFIQDFNYHLQTPYSTQMNLHRVTLHMSRAPLRLALKANCSPRSSSCGPLHLASMSSVLQRRGIVRILLRSPAGDRMQWLQALKDAHGQTQWSKSSCISLIYTVYCVSQPGMAFASSYSCGH